MELKQSNEKTIENAKDIIEALSKIGEAIIRTLVWSE
jgi:hypothetical protein